MAIAPGLDGFLAQRQAAAQEQNQQMGQLRGILGIQGAMQQQGILAQQLAEKQQQKARIADFAATLPPEEQPKFLMNPTGYLSNLDKKTVVTPGSTVLDGNNRPVYSATPKPEPTSPLARLTAERDRLPPGHPDRALYDAAITKATTHAAAPSSNVYIKQESEFGKKVGQELGDIYTGAIKGEFAAPRTIANYQRLGNLLSEVNTGKFTGTTTELKAAAKAFGMDLSSMGVLDDVAPAQATRQISNMLALELRNPAGGAGMPGAMSDKDREFLQQSIPSIENDPGAIKKMLEYRIRLARRDQEVGKLARDYRKRTGKFDEGFFDELKTFSEKNPLFPEANATASGAGDAPPPGAVRRID